MPILKNPKHELYAQNLASGMGQTEAYEAAGYKANSGNAATLKADQSVSKRVFELQSAGASAAERALTAKQRFIAKGWERAAEALEQAAPEDMPSLKALVDSVLSAEKDQRVTDGGVSDRNESAREVRTHYSDGMLEALAKRMAAQEDASTVKASGKAH